MVQASRVPEPSVCAEVCRQSGWIGEILFVVLSAVLAAWNRQLFKQKTTLAVEKSQLEQRVEQLSLRPPAVPLAISFPGLGPEIVAAMRPSLVEPDTAEPPPPLPPRRNP